MEQNTDRIARQNVAVLVAAQAILGSQMSTVFIVGGLAGKALATNPCLATLPISATVVGSMLTATPLSGVMQRHGRRAGFVAGAAGGASGAALASLALWWGNFWLFVAGSLLIGIYMSAQGFYRFAAADMASDAFRPKAISWVMAGGLLSALIGPEVVKLTVDSQVIPFLGTYLAVIGLNALGVFVFLGLKVAVPPPVIRGTPSGRTRGQLLRDPTIVVAMICATVSYALMNLVMTSTPLAVVGCGYGKADAANVVASHVLAMYAPSFFTGHVIARFGAARVVAVGLVILGGAGVVAMSGFDLMHFFGTLILLGLGWNFGFIGATAMLTAQQSPAERGRLQGLNDLVVFGGVTAASFFSGGLMNCAGGPAASGWQAVNMTIFPFLTLAGAALIWLALRPRETR